MDHPAIGPDGRIGSDKRMDDLGPFPDYNRPSNNTADHFGFLAQANPADDLALGIAFPANVPFDIVIQDGGIGRQEIIFLPGIQPPPFQDMAFDQALHVH